jgi:DNA-binding PadR family transcriptional regulator
MTRTASLGEFEQLVLLAILRLGERATVARIARTLEDRAGRSGSRSALYTSLDRLERKGFLRWEVEAASSERGGYPVRRFSVTPAGLDAAREAYAAWASLSAGLQDLLGGRTP